MKTQIRIDESKTYNGWKNYETWCVALWIDNEPGEYLFWRDRAKATLSELELADELKSHHEDAIHDMKLYGFAADLMNAALSEVDWREIAEHLRTG